MDTKTAATQIITVLILTAFVVITNSAPAAINHAEVSFSYRERERGILETLLCLSIDP